MQIRMNAVVHISIVRLVPESTKRIELDLEESKNDIKWKILFLYIFIFTV